MNAISMGAYAANSVSMNPQFSGWKERVRNTAAALSVAGAVVVGGADAVGAQEDDVPEEGDVVQMVTNGDWSSFTYVDDSEAFWPMEGRYDCTIEILPAEERLDNGTRDLKVVECETEEEEQEENNPGRIFLWASGVLTILGIGVLWGQSRNNNN